jgi:hypothetical protein
MARDNRRIVRGVRIGAQYDENNKVTADPVVYTEGQEDELAADLPKERIAQLVQDGSLEGDWGVEIFEDAKDKPAAKPASKPHK